MNRGARRAVRKLKDDVGLGYAAYAIIMSDPKLSTIYHNFIENRKSVLQYVLTKKLQGVFKDYMDQLHGTPIDPGWEPEQQPIVPTTTQTKKRVTPTPPSQTVLEPTQRRYVHPRVLHKVAKTLSRLSRQYGDSDVVHALYIVFLAEFGGNHDKALVATEEALGLGKQHFAEEQTPTPPTSEPQATQPQPPQPEQVLAENVDVKQRAAPGEQTKGGEHHWWDHLEQVYQKLGPVRSKVHNAAVSVYNEVAPRAKAAYNVVKDKVVGANEAVKRATGGYVDPLHWLHKLEQIAMFIPKTTQKVCVQLARRYGKSEEEAAKLQKTLYISDFLGGYGTGFLGSWLGKMIAGAAGGLAGAKIGMFFPSASLLYLVYLGSKKSKDALKKAYRLLTFWKNRRDNGNQS